MKIGLFGGSFDPVTKQHEQIVKEALNFLNLDRIYVIPTNINPWKNDTVASNEQRFEMLEEVFKNDAKITVSDYELSVGGINYTINTIEYFKSIHQNDTLYYIMGMDQVQKFDQWFQAKKIASIIQLVCFQRGNYMCHPNIEKFNFLVGQNEAIIASSSAFKKGDINQVSKKVLQYITNHGLYLENIIEPTMSKKRFIHTVSMAKVASEIANENQLNGQDAYIAGMFHDIAKEYSVEKNSKIMQEHFLNHMSEAKAIWHQYTSSYVANHKYFIESNEILDAIKYHTTAKIGMSKLGMCIFVADKYDPSREYDSSQQIELCKKDIELGFRQCLQDNFEYFKQKGMTIDEEMVRIYNYYCGGKENG